MPASGTRDWERASTRCDATKPTARRSTSSQARVNRGPGPLRHRSGASPAAGRGEGSPRRRTSSTSSPAVRAAGSGTRARREIGAWLRWRRRAWSGFGNAVQEEPEPREVPERVHDGIDAQVDHGTGAHGHGRLEKVQGTAVLPQTEVDKRGVFRGHEPSLAQGPEPVGGSARRASRRRWAASPDSGVPPTSVATRPRSVISSAVASAGTRQL